MLKKISTVARVKPFYVACSKNGFLPWTMEYDQRQLLAQFRSTSKSGISSGAFLVVLQIAMHIMLSPMKPGGPNTEPLTKRLATSTHGISSEATSMAAQMNAKPPARLKRGTCRPIFCAFRQFLAKTMTRFIASDQ